VDTAAIEHDGLYVGVGDASSLVWDLPVRVTHWLLVACVAGCWATHYAGVEWFQWHRRLGYGALVLVAFRIVWGFVGTRHARFSNFLRGPRALLVIGASIPISLFFAIITLHVLGRTLNIVSLAGLAFSTGIVVDAALIVQGNVLRLVQQGRDARQATIEGTSEVMPALVASMLTSIAIFLPILFMEGLEGQLFKDLAITMSVSHAASLLVAMTVIPAANRWALEQAIPADHLVHEFELSKCFGEERCFLCRVEKYRYRMPVVTEV
jgi:hypothetical protein